MRCGPSSEQLVADSLVWSEQLRSSATAGCDDVLGFVAKLGRMPSFASTVKGEVPVTTLIKLCADWGLRWMGKPIQKQTWNHIQAIMPYANDDGIASAIGDIRRIYGDFDKLTTLGKVFQAASGFIKGGFMISEFQEMRSTVFAMRWALRWFYNGLRFGDFDRKQVNNNFLVGERQTQVGTIQVYFRKLQALDVVWKYYRSSPAFSPAIGEALWEKFSDVTAFVNWATADDFWQKDQSAEFVAGQKGLNHFTAQKFQEFCDDLPGQAAVALAELLYGIMTAQFDLAFLAHAQASPDGGSADYDSIVNMLRGTDAGEPLAAAFKKCSSALAGQAVSLDDEQSGQPLAALLGQSLTAFGDDEGAEAAHLEEKKQLYDKVVADKESKVRFHALPHLPAGPLASFMGGTELNKILASCKFQTNRKLGPAEKAKCNAWVLSADLFPGCMSGGPKDFRLPTKHFQETPVPASLKSLWNWILSVRKPDDLIVVFDGRFSQVRRFFDGEMSKLGPQSFVMDMWIIYETPENDFRYPKRQLAFSNNNREVVLVYRPVPKKKTTCKARQAFNACGEKSSFDLTYSGVQLRSLGELPKLTPEDKKKILGTELDVPLSYPGEDQPLAVDGVPFAWTETKPVGWLAAFFKELGIDHIFDTTTGSAAAGIAAHYAGIQYDGVCCNPLHKTWNEQVMNQAMFAIIADGGAGSTPEFVKKILHFFGPSVDEGMRMLKVTENDKKQQAANANAGEEENLAEDDEDDDDDEDGY